MAMLTKCCELMDRAVEAHVEREMLRHIVQALRGRVRHQTPAFDCEWDQTTRLLFFSVFGRSMFSMGKIKFEGWVSYYYSRSLGNVR